MCSTRWSWLVLVVLLLLLYAVSGRLLSVPVTDDPQPVKAAVLALEQTLAEVYVAENGTVLHKCRLYEINTPDDAKRVLDTLNLPKVNVTLPEMISVIENCKAFALDSGQDEEVNDVSNSTSDEEGSRGANNGSRPWGSITPGILPGTKWCGMGDIASSYEELGPRRELDRCCRAHDYCPVKLKAFKSGWGLINFSLYTKSHCDCDTKFYDCLKQTNSNLSNVLGNFYFNIMKVQCMKPQRPMVCAEKIVPLEGKSQCIRWKYVPNAPRMAFVDPERRF